MNGMLITEDGSPICNFSLRVESFIDVICDQVKEDWIRVELTFENGVVKTKELPLSGLDKMTWNEIDPTCILYSKEHIAAMQIANWIRSQLTDDLPRETRYKVNEVGMHHIGDTVVFAAADRVITQSSGNNFHVEVSDEVGLRLDVDESITLPEAYAGVLELISLVPGVGEVLLAHTTSGIIRGAFVKAGFTPNAVLMVVGKSGMMKSSYVPQITQLYDRANGAKANTRFNSSTSFIEEDMGEYRHCTYVIDDIHTGSSSSIKRRNETTAEEMLRRISDDTGRGRKNGKELVQHTFEGNAVYISEYVIGVESTVARMLCVEMTPKPDGKVLDKYQREKKLLMPTFYLYFIQWYVDKFEDIRKMIDIRLAKFRESKVLSQVHGRLADTLFYLMISEMVLLEFLVEHQLLTFEQASAAFCEFELLVFKLIDKQQRKLDSHDSRSTEMNYLRLISELFHNGAFNLAPSIGEFDTCKHDGTIHKDYLCLRGDSLDKIVCRKSGCDLKFLVNHLKAQDALKLVSAKNTVQLKNGKRFYAIKLSKLD